MSVSGGLPLAVERALEVGATALQVFVKSSRQWSARPLQADEIAAFRGAAEDHALTPYTLAHSSYLINLASADDALWNRSLAAFDDELARCAELGIGSLVLHPGSHVGQGEEAGLRKVACALKRALGGRTRHDAVTVLLETTAGQGSNLGHRFEQIGWLIEHSGVEKRLGVCFDTCHVLAAGYDIRDARGFRATLAEFEQAIGLERLRAFHLNDSKFGPGSRKDRHEHIGEGEVGLEAFRLIVNDARFRELPMVLETPKGRDLAEDHSNLARLRDLVGRKPR
jgi:deoxyribonuclease-4